MPPLGIMVEVPSVAIAPEAFSDVAFFSIGSNDLTQYVMAAARDNGDGRRAELGAQPRRAEADRPGRGVRQGERHSGQPVRRRGGDPASIPALLEAGLRDLSVVPPQLAMAKAAIAARRGLRLAGMGEPEKEAGTAAEEAIRAYKTILSAVIDRRPSGMRQRLADALGKHRSFVTQICSPAYSIPIPSKHLPQIFSSLPFQRRRARPFPRRLPHGASRQDAGAGGLRKTRHLSLTVPDLGDDEAERRARPRRPRLHPAHHQHHGQGRG